MLHAATHDQQLRNALAIAIVKSKKQKDAEIASCQQKIATLEHELIRAKAATSQLYKLVRRHISATAQQLTGTNSLPPGRAGTIETASPPTSQPDGHTDEALLYAAGLAEVQAQLAALDTTSIQTTSAAQEALLSKASSMGKLLQHMQMMQVVNAAQQKVSRSDEISLAGRLLDAPAHQHCCSFITDVLLHMPPSAVRSAYMSASATTLGGLLNASSTAGSTTSAPGSSSDQRSSVEAHLAISNLVDGLVHSVIYKGTPEASSSKSSAAPGVRHTSSRPPPSEACMQLLGILQQVPCLGLHILLSTSRALEACSCQLASFSSSSTTSSDGQQGSSRNATQHHDKACMFQQMRKVFNLQVR
jgi:hypothetical protein